jgi:enamine deaminase RidA (YjgF/YER057c/UK114 family)
VSREVLAADGALGFTRGDASAPVAGMRVLGERLHLPEGGTAEAAPALIEPGAPVHERWWVGGDAGRWLYGSVVVDDALHPRGMEGAAEDAYTQLFDLLAERGQPHLLRLWNYMARINEVAGELERYRQFNVGRQRAFMAARRSAFVGAPAACALGTERGPLTLHFLAGEVAPRAVENPRQVSAYRYPSVYGPSSPTFSRAALADVGGGREALFISGTASIVGHATLHAGDVRAQAEEAMNNIDALLQSAAQQGARAAHGLGTLDCTVYLRHASDLPTVREVIARRTGAHRAIYLRADICRSDLLMEIEAHSLQGHPA